MDNSKDTSFSVEFLLGICMSVLAGLLASLALMTLVMLLPAEVKADELSHGYVKKNDMTSGSVLLKTESAGLFKPATVLNTDVHMRVNGMVVRTKVVQRFKNPGSSWVEGVYVFPLPEKAAVDHMRMKIGERIIEGQIKEKQQAKKIYAKAKREGRKASLIEQERPNIFTNSIANIGPGETISVEIEYQQTLRFDKDRFRLRFPLVVAPRYIPGKVVNVTEHLAGFNGTGWAMNTDQVPDASRITPPVNSPAEKKSNPVSIQVDLNAGFPLVRVQSTYHKINKQIISPEKMTLSLQNKAVPADRDFELVWQPDRGHIPRAALFSEQKGNDRYLMLMVMPPDHQQAQQQTLNREVIYVIDTSGSMGGTSIRQARKALRYAIKDLKPGDYFNVIQFNSHTSKLFEYAVPADQVNISQALAYVGALKAGGGTEMATALNAALEHNETTGLLRQVIFLTDGSIGNEDSLFSIIKRKLSNSRLFTVGIGSAPNSHFMSKAAQFGRGSYTYIGKLDEVDEKMSGLFKKIQTPLLTDIKIDWPVDKQVEMWPRRVPDLYAGEPLVVTARTTALKGSVIVSGKRLQQQWKVTIPLNVMSQSQGMAVLWARDKIAYLMDALQDGMASDVVRKGVLDVALEHHLVSKYTSLVAVDVTPERPLTENLKKESLKVNLPAGWKHGKVFPALPQTATDSFWDLLLGLMLIVLGCALALYFQRTTHHEA